MWHIKNTIIYYLIHCRVRFVIAGKARHQKLDAPVDPYVGILLSHLKKEILVTDTSTQPGQNTDIVENLKTFYHCQ